MWLDEIKFAPPKSDSDPVAVGRDGVGGVDKE
jgi:hypothetical protein